MSSNFENPQTGHKFFMKWDTTQRQSHYKVPTRTQSSTLAKVLSKTVGLNSCVIDGKSDAEQFPFSWRERKQLAQSMSATEILQTSEYVVDTQNRRQRKWKEMRYFWKSTVQDKVFTGNLENAFWLFGTSKVSVNQFVMTIVKEYKINNDLGMESHLRWLYLSMEGGKEGRADWRELFSVVMAMTLFRLIKKRPEEMLLKVFGVYCQGGEQGGRQASQHRMHLLGRSDLLRILRLPVLTDSEEEGMLEFFDAACLNMSLDLDARIFLPDFKMLLADNR